MTGAAPKPPELHYELKRELGGVGAVSVYGSTEVPFISVSSVHDGDEQLARTEGRALAGAEIRVVDADGRVCAPGEVGELRVRGPQVCRGYLDETLDADAVDRDGFFRTGDLGALDAEGFVTITGRLKDVIIRKGENISAKEVEDVLYTHPAVAEVAVIGLRDRELGERCCAVLVLRDGNQPVSAVDIASFCREAGLANQKIPERVEIIDELPRNASGKVLKYRLQERYDGGTA
jgi:acyl-CoA synthetase (AMP-forming)/AMP-acid ligase II